MRAKRLAGVDLSTEAASEIFPLFSKAFVFTLVMLGALLAFGLYQREHQRNELGYTVRLIISFLTGLLIMMINFYAAPALALGRGVFGLTVLFAFTGVLTARAVFLRLADRRAFGRRLLVLGAGTRAARVAALEHVNGSSEKFHVVGYLPLNGVSNGVDPSLILREPGSLQSIAQQYQIEEIVVGVRVVAPEAKR